MTERPASRSVERLAEAARKAAARERELRQDPEPSLGKRLGQIGVLGWIIVLPALAGVSPVGGWTGPCIPAFSSRRRS